MNESFWLGVLLVSVIIFAWVVAFALMRMMRNADVRCDVGGDEHAFRLVKRDEGTRWYLIGVIVGTIAVCLFINYILFHCYNVVESARGHYAAIQE